MKKPKIVFLNHASFIIQQNNVKILVDPYLFGSAFNNGWNLLTEVDHSKEIKRRPSFIPIAYPHDGNRRDSMGNPGLADQYRNHGCNFLLEHFTNPPALGQSKGSNSVEEGIQKMLVAMEEGRFKIFSNLDN